MMCPVNYDYPKCNKKDIIKEYLIVHNVNI